MKKNSRFSKLVLIILSFSLFYNCTKDTTIQSNTIKLKFFDSQKINKNNNDFFVFYNIEMNHSNEIIDYDPNLQLIEAKNVETGQISSMFVELFQHKNGGIETGYFFSNNCFVYGTMIYGDNGVNLFIPCGVSCIGFDDICANWNEAFAIL